MDVNTVEYSDVYDPYGRNRISLLEDQINVLSDHIADLQRELDSAIRRIETLEIQSD